MPPHLITHAWSSRTGVGSEPRLLVTTVGCVLYAWKFRALHSHTLHLFFVCKPYVASRRRPHSLYISGVIYILRLNVLPLASFFSFGANSGMTERFSTVHFHSDAATAKQR